MFRNVFQFIFILLTITPQVIFAEINSLPSSFRVGVIAPLSGNLAEYGISLQNGIELARESNQSIFKSVEFFYEDSRYESKLALAAFSKLRVSDKVDLIFVWGSGPTEAVAPVAQRLKYPLITLGEHTAAIGRPYIINFANPSFQFSKVLAEHLRKKMATQNLDLPTFGTDFFESTTEIKDAGPGIEGAVYAHNIVLDSFRSKYITKHRNDIQLPTAARGYDFAILIAEQLNSLGLPLNGQKLFNSLVSLPTQAGASGDYQFVDDLKTGKHFQFPIRVKMVKNGKILEASS